MMIKERRRDRGQAMAPIPPRGTASRVLYRFFRLPRLEQAVDDLHCHVPAGPQSGFRLLTGERSALIAPRFDESRTQLLLYAVAHKSTRWLVEHFAAGVLPWPKR